MMWHRLAGVTVAVAAFAGVVLPACAAQPDPRRPVPLTVTSSDFVVDGEYRLVDRDRVEALTIDNGRVVLKAAPSDLAIDLPPAADPARPLRHWALVTDAHVDGRRMITFTHSQDVKDFSIELPDGDAPVRFAAFAARTGDGEILVFASGDRAAGPPSLFGQVLIHPK
jgi:hypothetical protein